MSVPLDKLYHYLDDMVDHDVVIYRWRTHGSRNLEDFGLHDQSYSSEPAAWWPVDRFFDCQNLVCHDQEPLFFDYFRSDEYYAQIQKITKHPDQKQNEDLKRYLECPDPRRYLLNQNLGALVLPSVFPYLLLHSELHSAEVKKYADNYFVPVYYWSHAMICRDWFRYAEHDPALKFDCSSFRFDFVVYNRAWTGTREYRLFFLYQLLNFDLKSATKISFCAEDNGHFYQNHQFQNSRLKPPRVEFDQLFEKNQAPSHASAEYDARDYQTCAVDVVLETLCDDQRWHLTEKILRPIACGKPFVLVSTPGALKYLRQYGFQTFSPFIDESYDDIEDVAQRIPAIAAELRRLSQLPQQQKQKIWYKLHDIARRNKERFFSDQFHQQIIKEYQDNFREAYQTAQSQPSKKIIDDLYSLAENHDPNPYWDIMIRAKHNVNQWFDHRAR